MTANTTPTKYIQLSALLSPPDIFSCFPGWLQLFCCPPCLPLKNLEALNMRIICSPAGYKMPLTSLWSLFSGNVLTASWNSVVVVKSMQRSLPSHFKLCSPFFSARRKLNMTWHGITDIVALWFVRNVYRWRVLKNIMWCVLSHSTQTCAFVHYLCKCTSPANRETFVSLVCVISTWPGQVCHNSELWCLTNWHVWHFNSLEPRQHINCFSCIVFVPFYPMCL